MQNRIYNTQAIASSKKSQPRIQTSSVTPSHSVAAGSASTTASTTASTAGSTAKDELARVFNTALVSTQVGEKRDFSAELCELTESASFKTILNAVRQLARVQGVSERTAAEQVIQTFRKMDEIWGEYIFREGIDRLRNPRN